MLLHLLTFPWNAVPLLIYKSCSINFVRSLLKYHFRETFPDYQKSFPRYVLFHFRDLLFSQHLPLLFFVCTILCFCNSIQLFVYFLSLATKMFSFVSAGTLFYSLLFSLYLGEFLALGGAHHILVE